MKKIGPSLKDGRSPMSARRRVRGAGGFRIQGNSYTKLEHGLAMDGVTAGGSTMTSVSVDVEKDDVNPMLVDQLLGINKTLEKQIETLRLRLDFDARHYEAQKNAVKSESTKQILEKNDEVKKLKEKINEKDVKLDGLATSNEMKDAEIMELKQQLEKLTKDVECAKTYADDMVHELEVLTEEKQRLEGGAAYEDKEKEITGLRKEIDVLNCNLAVLEKELEKARESMASQNAKMRFLENDRKNMQLKFKEELAKVSQSMRLEVEKMRDVMRKQWEEMRFLREQNTSMSRDIKDIRNLLVSGSMDDDTKMQQETVVSHSPHPPAASKPSRAQPYVSSYSMSPLKPSLPVLNKEAKRVLPGRRKEMK